MKRKYFSPCHHPLPLFRVSSYRKRNQLCDIMFAKDFAVNGKKEMKNMFLNHFGKKIIFSIAPKNKLSVFIDCPWHLIMITFSFNAIILHQINNMFVQDAASNFSLKLQFLQNYLKWKIWFMLHTLHCREMKNFKIYIFFNYNFVQMLIKWNL